MLYRVCCGWHSLNVTFSSLGSVLARGSSLVVILMVCREFGGIWARKMRQVFARGEKGLNLVEMEVRNLVIMMGWMGERASLERIGR